MEEDGSESSDGGNSLEMPLEEEEAAALPDWANATIDESDGKIICPAASCQKIYANWNSYRAHVKAAHKCTFAGKKQVCLLDLVG